jgi:hypothetical protein
VWGEVWFTAEAATVTNGRAEIPPKTESEDLDSIMVRTVARRSAGTGHWARTDERGEFRLFGCEPPIDYLQVGTPGSDRKTFFNGAS